MSWELRRRLIYAFVVIVTLTAVTIFFLQDTLFPAPTCVDGKKNGQESGIDCGGVCALRCSQEVVQLTALWSKAIPLGNSMYDLVALINNSNIDNASRIIGYTFTIYDDQGLVSDTFSGSSTAPLDGKFPVIIQNVSLKNAPSNVTVKLSDGPHYIVQESPTSPTIKVLNRNYEESGNISRVNVVLMNTKRIEINNLPIRVLLYDEKDNVYAVGQTIVPYLAKEGLQQAIFTWDAPLPFAPTRIGVYPIFNPFEAIGY